MTDTSIEVDTSIIEHLDEDWSPSCEIPDRAARSPGGWPECPGRVAEWIGWKMCPCNTGPRYTLLCEPCKEFYSRSGGMVICTWCGAVTDPPKIERLNKG